MTTRVFGVGWSHYKMQYEINEKHLSNTLSC